MPLDASLYIFSRYKKARRVPRAWAGGQGHEQTDRSSLLGHSYQVRAD